jgi:hypothetical protein
MTGALLDLAELAARAEVPVDRLRHFAEVGLLPPAGRDGDRFVPDPPTAQPKEAGGTAGPASDGGGATSRAD